MRLTRRALRQMILEEVSRLRLSLILEAEGDEKKGSDEGESEESENPTTDELFGSEGEPEDAEEKSDEPSDESETDSGEDEETEETIPKDEVEEMEEEAREEGALAALTVKETIGAPIALAVQDAFDSSVKSRNVVDDIAMKKESLSRVAWGSGRGALSRLLFEDQRPEIDMAMYCQRIANLITNYDSILDIEKAIFDAAYNMLSSNKDLGPDVADEFKDILARDYDLDFDHVYDPEKADQPIYAAGSRKPESA